LIWWSKLNLARFFIFRPLTATSLWLLVPGLMTSVTNMNEVRMPEATDLGASFAQASTDATRRLCEHGQSVAKAISESVAKAIRDWNTEVNHFLSHRAARNGETMNHVVKCQNLPEILALQAQWMQGTSEDYLKEMSKLMEVGSRVMGGLLGSFGQIEVQSAEPARSSTAMVPMRAAS
jgi:hypothetical protein